MKARAFVVNAPGSGGGHERRDAPGIEDGHHGLSPVFDALFSCAQARFSLMENELTQPTVQRPIKRLSDPRPSITYGIASLADIGCKRHECLIPRSPKPCVNIGKHAKTGFHSTETILVKVLETTCHRQLRALGAPSLQAAIQPGRLACQRPSATER